GLIEGAHRGAGLGHRFLRHVERCRLLLHLVDPSLPESRAVDDIRTVDDELRLYRASLARKPQILVLTKADAVQDAEAVEAVRELAARRGVPCVAISAVTGEGLELLVRRTGDELDRLAAHADEETPAGADLEAGEE